MFRLPAGRVLVVLVTTACNLRCAYCYLADRHPRQIGWRPLCRALDWLLAAPTDSARVVFSGGEPLLALPTIARAIAYLDRHCPQGLQVDREIITNGLLLDDEAVAFLVDHGFSIQLSFDGVPHAQDLRGHDTFASLDRLLRRLRRDRPTVFERQLSIASTVCRDNVAHLADSMAYFLGSGVASVSIEPALARDARWTRGDTVMLDRQLAQVFRDSLDHYRRTGEVPLQVFKKGWAEEPCADRRGAMCRIGAGHALAVDVTGRAVACSLFASGYHTPGSELLDAAAAAAALGPVAGPSLDARLASVRRKVETVRLFGARAEKRSARRRCRSCKYLERCTACPVSIGLVPGNTDPDRIPDFQCAFVRTSLKYRDRFPPQPSLRGALARLQRLRQSIAARESAGLGP